MTTAAFHEVQRIWNVSTVQRDPRAIRFMSGFAMLLTAAVPIVAINALVREHTLPVLLLLRILLGIGGFWMMIVWIWLFVPSAVTMNSAANARLMPRQRRRLLQMAVGGWLATVLALTLALGEWAAFPFIGLYVLGFALMRAGHMAALALTILPGFWPILSKVVLPAPVAQALAKGVGLSLVVLAVMACGVLALARIVPAAGDRHLAARGEQLKRMNCFGVGGWASASQHKGFMTAINLSTYFAILRRDSRAPRPDAMLMHALGPAGHWSAWLTSIVVIALLHLAAYTVVLVRGEAATRSFIDGFSYGGLSGLAFMIAFGTAHIRQQLDRTRGEQALLLLTPLAGDKAALNRRLAVRLLQGALLQWVLLVGVVLAMGSLFGGADLLLRQFALCCLGGQVALGSLFGDFSRSPKVGIARAMLLGMLVVVEALAAAGLGWLGGAVAHWTWVWLIAFSVSGGTFLVWRGWKTLMRAPVAFPAGRLG
jgi:hypothetical protein